jgi:putative peptidoglycan lipid II flippase
MMSVGLFGLGITQVNIAVALFFAAFLGEGNVTYLTYANRLIQFPMALTATAMATAMLPNLTQLLLDGEHGELRRTMGFAKRVEVVLMLPAMLGLILFGMPIVELLFERGAFTPEDSTGTNGALLYYALGLLPLGWLRLILPVFYARKDVTTPVKAAFVSMLANIALGAFFTFFTSMEQRGLALASTLAAFVNYGVLQFYLARDPAMPLAESRLTETMVKCSLAGLLGVGGPWLLYHGAGNLWGYGDATFHRALLLIPAVAISIPLYFALAHLFRVPESDRAVDMIRRRLTRK